MTQTNFAFHSIACEQALCLGKNSEEREGKGGERALFAFPSPHPARPAARLKACSQATHSKALYARLPSVESKHCLFRVFLSGYGKQQVLLLGRM